MNAELAELIGIIIGDGFLDNCQKHYRIGIVGNPKNEIPYYEYIKTLIKNVWDKDVKMYHRERGLRIVINSKSAFLELVNKYKIPKGNGKSQKVTIPKCILNEWSLAKHTIRGIVDTDGSVFTANKPGSPNYPSIEITTTSYKLAKQLKAILSLRGFRVAKIWADNRNDKVTPAYRVPLNGYKNLELWMKEIGFSNPIKLEKANKILNQNSSSPGSS